MSLAELNEINRDYLTPQQVGKILNCAPYSINVQAKRNKDDLGFPVIIIGNRVKIPKQAFIEYMKGISANNNI